LKALKALQAFLVEDVSATEDRLLLKSQVFIAYGTWLLVIETFERLLFDLPPLDLAQGQLRLLN
jgi:hypothetical protein